MNDITIITKDNLPEPIYNDNGKMIDMWILDHNNVPVHVIAGENQHVLKNGAIYDDTTHRVVKASPVKLDTNRAGELWQKRQEQTKEAIIHAIACADTQKLNSLKAGVKALASAQVDLALQGNAYSTRAYEALLRSAGLMVDDKTAQTQGGMSITMDHATAQRVIEAMIKKRGEED